MIVSSKGRYALRVMIDLAQHDNGELISLKGHCQTAGDFHEISGNHRRYPEPGRYAHKRRGKKGGYRLKYRTEEYTVGSILKLTGKNVGSGELSGNRERLLRAGGKMHHSASLAEAGRDDRRVSGRDYP